MRERRRPSIKEKSIEQREQPNMDMLWTHSARISLNDEYKEKGKELKIHIRSNIADQPQEAYQI